MKALSLRAGLTESGIRDAIGRGRSPSIDNFVKIAEALGVSPVYLLQGDERFRLKVPIIGTASSHDMWVPSKVGKAATNFDLDVAGGDMISIRIEGDGMSPVYRDGDELVCQRRSGGNVDNLVGLDCVVETTDGRRYVKIIAKGTGMNVYNLRSFNPVVRDVENVAIAWAAPILVVKRASV